MIQPSALLVRKQKRKYWAESWSQGLSQTPQLTLSTCQVGVVRPVCRWHYVAQGSALCKWARPKSQSGFPTVQHWSPARPKFLSWLSVLSFLWKTACIQKYTAYNANIYSCYLEERMANMTQRWNAARHTHTPPNQVLIGTQLPIPPHIICIGFQLRRQCWLIEIETRWP